MFIQRFLEIIPGALVWITIVASIVLSFVYPLAVIYFVIVFDLYWLFRVCNFMPILILSWWRYRKAIKKNWQPLAEAQAGYGDIRHLVFLPTYKEQIGVIRETLECITKSAYPANRIMIVLAGEERDRENFEQSAELLKQNLKAASLHFCQRCIQKIWEKKFPGKGSNLHWSGHAVLPQVLSMHLNPDHVIVSSFVWTR